MICIANELLRKIPHNYEELAILIKFYSKAVCTEIGRNTMAESGSGNGEPMHTCIPGDCLNLLLLC